MSECGSCGSDDTKVCMQCVQKLEKDLALRLRTVHRDMEVLREKVAAAEEHHTKLLKNILGMSNEVGRLNARIHHTEIVLGIEEQRAVDKTTSELEQLKAEWDRGLRNIKRSSQSLPRIETKKEDGQ